MSKPEIAAIVVRRIGERQCGRLTEFGFALADGEKLIRLADHERLQAEAERLQDARAADKARIAELTTLLADIKAWDVDQMLTIPLAIRKRMQEVLAQQGKEGET